MHLYEISFRYRDLNKKAAVSGVNEESTQPPL